VSLHLYVCCFNLFTYAAGLRSLRVSGLDFDLYSIIWCSDQDVALETLEVDRLTGLKQKYMHDNMLALLQVSTLLLIHC
jgi:hypothetical protein